MWVLNGAWTRVTKLEVYNIRIPKMSPSQLGDYSSSALPDSLDIMLYRDDLLLLSTANQAKLDTKQPMA